MYKIFFNRFLRLKFAFKLCSERVRRLTDMNPANLFESNRNDRSRPVTTKHKKSPVFQLGFHL